MSAAQEWPYQGTARFQEGLGEPPRRCIARRTPAPCFAGTDPKLKTEVAMHWTTQHVLAGLLAAMPAMAAETQSTIEISNAWTPALAQTRVDTPVYMTIANRSEGADSLVRVRCPVADFAEKHATDRGEGGLAMREVKAIVIPSGGTVTLAPRGAHLMLLHTKQALQPGETFTCSIVFQKAGTLPVEVTVAPGGAEDKS